MFCFCFGITEIKYKYKYTYIIIKYALSIKFNLYFVAGLKVFKILNALSHFPNKRKFFRGSYIFIYSLDIFCV